MQTNPSVFRQHKIYFAGLLLILLSGALFLLFNGKSATFISLNAYHPFILNVFFINYTFIGDGIFALCLIAAILFYYKRKQQGLALLYSFLISGLIVQLIKNLVDSPRPRLFFEAGQYLNFIDGVSLANNSSFPSGHTATAFAIATVMALMMKDKSWQLLILIAAILVGYSRIYLAQHFLLDVMIGALIGSASGILAVYLAKNIKGIKRSIKKMHRISPGTPPSPSAVQPV
ncbi:phosphatase PAP2 family protein [Ferruginibacter sp. SUN106]|uniref:phosphatase PAP2 family protein n=1 Tax=Ferruginibacter sp. SUN106 TaxID=2978348 RepID=UPI003D36774F